MNGILMPLLCNIGTARAAPTPCDPAQPASDDAPGYCVSEGEYVELGELRTKVDGLETIVETKNDEIKAFGSYKRAMDQELLLTIDGMTAAHERGIDLVVKQCQEDIQGCERTWWDKNAPLVAGGVGIGIGVGLTIAVLKVAAAAL